MPYPGTKKSCAKNAASRSSGQRLFSVVLAVITPVRPGSALSRELAEYLPRELMFLRERLSHESSEGVSCRES